MRSVNPQVYPITAQLTQDVIDAGKDSPRAQEMVDVVGEYEHGAADVEDLNPSVSLKQYAAVVLDIILSTGSEP